MKKIKAQSKMRSKCKDIKAFAKDIFITRTMISAE